MEVVAVHVFKISVFGYRLMFNLESTSSEFQRFVQLLHVLMTAQLYRRLAKGLVSHLVHTSFPYLAPIYTATLWLRFFGGGSLVQHTFI